MLTLFAVPKAFRGHIGVIQTNAIQSWTLLRPPCEVILFGDEEGTAETAAKFGIQHVPDVECNEYGTPLVSSLFSSAQKLGSHELMCYINSDVILMSDFLPAVQSIAERRCLLAGRRWDLDVNEPIDFDSPDWEAGVRDSLSKTGRLHRATGHDYFVYSRDLYRDLYGSMPPFAAGRPGYDNWIVFKARSLRIPVVDATKVVTAVHQNHDYSHHPMGEEGVWKGIEAKRNRAMLGGKYCSFNLWDATHILTPDGLKPALSIRHLYWRLQRLPETHPHFTPVVIVIRGLRSLVYGTGGLRRKWRLPGRRKKKLP